MSDTGTAVMARRFGIPLQVLEITQQHSQPLRDGQYRRKSQVLLTGVCALRS
jgi:hypothetical protein